MGFKSADGANKHLSHFSQSNRTFSLLSPCLFFNSYLIYFFFICCFLFFFVLYLLPDIQFRTSVFSNLSFFFFFFNLLCFYV